MAAGVVCLSQFLYNKLKQTNWEREKSSRETWN